ncbi:MAG: NADH-quinone oxidoreductase subunit B [Planctomycetota bacterium]|jgi:NADH-quinone oxidoreductase subunit B
MYTTKPEAPQGVAAGELSLGDSIITTKLSEVVNWARGNSLWPFPFGTACCAIEFMGSVSSVFDLSRFGAEVVRFSPRQADLMIIAGTVTYKMVPVLRQIYDQMCDPKWVISAGACACTGGFYDCYCTVPGVDEVVPVDIYVAGCPPRPEAFLEAVVQLQDKITAERPSEAKALGIADIA